MRHEAQRNWGGGGKSCEIGQGSNCAGGRKIDQRGWQEGDGGRKGGGRVVSSRGKWILLEEDGLPARGKILDKSEFVYLYRSQIAIPRGGIICAKKPNKTNTQKGLVIF